jgi:hypothetical protein
VLAKNGVSRQVIVNKSHDIQFPWKVMPSEPMMIAGLSECLPPAKISMSMATAHGGSFSYLFWWFSLSILQGFYVRLVQNMRFWYRNLVKTCWKKPFNCCQFCSICQRKQLWWLKVPKSTMKLFRRVSEAAHLYQSDRQPGILLSCHNVSRIQNLTSLEDLAAQHFLDCHSTPLPMHTIKPAFSFAITIWFAYALSCSSILSLQEESQQRCYQYLVSVLSCA